jgi:queuine tRNA-ribosyltransferase
MSFFSLVGHSKDSNARAGLIQTAHGEIQTPIFMPVGTQATVKAVHFSELKNDIKAEIILGNTYHLYLRPGIDVLKNAGGLQKFGGWNKPMLTDSGGFQVYSLAHRRKITEEGVKFASHIDGSYHLFTPENVMDIQREIGADIIMAFDECTPYPCAYDYAKNSLGLTHRWLDRCIQHFEKSEGLYGYKQHLFPIVQGSVYKDLRIESAKYIADKGAVGNAIGGLAVGEPAEEMYEMIEIVNEILPQSAPRYLMGVGTPENILEAIDRGIDMFDCVMPTRNARHGYLFTHQGILHAKSKKWEFDLSPIDSLSSNSLIQSTSKSYLRHLFKCEELLAMQIASINNLSFYLELVREARMHILAGDYKHWKEEKIRAVMCKL